MDETLKIAIDTFLKECEELEKQNFETFIDKIRIKLGEYSSKINTLSSENIDKYESEQQIKNEFYAFHFRLVDFKEYFANEISDYSKFKIKEEPDLTNSIIYYWKCQKKYREAKEYYIDKRLTISYRNKLDHFITYFAHTISSFFLQINQADDMIVELRNRMNSFLLIYIYQKKTSVSVDNIEKTINEKVSNFDKHIDSIKEKIDDELHKTKEDFKEDLKSTEHKVTGHAMTLMGVLAAIITVIVTLTSTGVSIVKGFSFYEQLLMLIGIGILIISSVVLLLMISAYFFSDENRSQGAKNGLVISAKISGLIFYTFTCLLCVFFFIEKIYTQINSFYIQEIGFKLILGFIIFVMVLSIFLFSFMIKGIKLKSGRLEIDSKSKISIFSFVISLLTFIILCVVFLFSYYLTSIKHKNEPKIIIEHYEVIKVDDMPTEIHYVYKGTPYSISYDERLLHDEKLYFCEEHKTLE